MQSYLIPKGTTHYRQEIKKSRFLAWIKHIETPEMAKAWIQEISGEYPDARHVCWAYIAGAPNTPLQSMSDAGEPSGTAGKPILNVLQHSDAGEIGAVVVRYFGGIKLGTGGLVRAYSSSASETLKLTPLRLKVPQITLILNCPFAEEHTFRYLLEQSQGVIDSTHYANEVIIHCHLPYAELENFKQRLPISIGVIEP